MHSVWWAGPLVPVAVALFALAAARLDGALRARAAGAPVGANTPLRAAGGLLLQQRRRTVSADTLLWRSSGIVLLTAGVLASLVTPLGQWVAADLSVGVVWFNTAMVLAWAAVWLAGWGPNSVHSLVGGYRFVAQGLAYELPHMFVLTTVALGAGSLRVADIVAAQATVWFVVWMPAAFAVYLLSVLAMSFWGPFEHPAGEDIAGGVLAESSGVDRLVLLAGRWALLVSGAAFAVPLFLGGGAGPLLPAWLWSLVKISAVLGLLVWLGHRLPTIRMERYQEIAWMVLIPLTLLQALLVAVLVVVA